MADEELKIKVTLEGGKEAEKGLQDIGKAAEDAAGPAGSLGDGLGKAGSGAAEIADKGGEAADAVEDLGDSLGGIKGSSKGAMDSLGDFALKLSPWVIAIDAAVKIAAMVWDHYKEKREAAAKAEEEAQKQAQKEAEETKKHLEELDKARMEGARNAAKDLKEQLQGAADEAKRTRQEMDAMDDAELANTLAKIDLAEERGEIGGNEAAYRRSTARLGIAGRKADREAEALVKEEERLDQAVEGSAAEKADADRKLRDAASEAADALLALQAAEKELEEARQIHAIRSIGATSIGAPEELKREAAERVAAAEEAVRIARFNRDEAVKAKETASIEAAAAQGREEEAVKERDARVPEIRARRNAMTAQGATRNVEWELAETKYENASRKEAAKAEGAERAGGLTKPELDRAAEAAERAGGGELAGAGDVAAKFAQYAAAEAAARKQTEAELQALKRQLDTAIQQVANGRN